MFFSTSLHLIFLSLVVLDISAIFYSNSLKLFTFLLRLYRYGSDSSPFCRPSSLPPSKQPVAERYANSDGYSIHTSVKCFNAHTCHHHHQLGRVFFFPFFSFSFFITRFMQISTLAFADWLLRACSLLFHLHDLETLFVM